MNLEQITSRCAEICQSSAAFIKREADGFDKNKVELKGKSDLVSYVDKTAEEQLVSGLSALINSAGFITEENTVAQEQKEYTWIIDPLDGTTNFVHGIPNYAVSVGLLKGDTLVAGVIVEASSGDSYMAWKGGGAFLNGENIYANRTAGVENNLFSTGFPIHNFEKIDDYLAILNQLMKNSHGLRRMGSAAMDLAMVASGKFGAYFEYNLNSWDIAAGIVLVQEAGGTVTDFSGGDNYLFGREIVAGGAVHTSLLEIIKRQW